MKRYSIQSGVGSVFWLLLVNSLASFRKDLLKKVLLFFSPMFTDYSVCSHRSNFFLSKSNNFSSVSYHSVSVISCYVIFNRLLGNASHPLSILRIKKFFFQLADATGREPWIKHVVHLVVHAMTSRAAVTVSRMSSEQNVLNVQLTILIFHTLMAVNHVNVRVMGHVRTCVIRLVF